MNKIPTEHLEDVESIHDELRVTKSKVGVSGTVQLTAGSIVYIPAPTADPQDPLNMPIWKKLMVLVCISLFSTIGLALVSGFGGLLGFYIPDYVAAGKDYADITALMTFPTLTMGIGNLIGMPIAIAIGRRPVLLAATALMLASAGLCAGATNYDWHLAARMILGLAAGQSEALVPMITQEIFFLHERARFLMIQQTIQTIATGVFVLFASPIAAAITPAWWYGLGSILSGVSFFMAVLFVPETKYHRPASSYQEGNPDIGSEGDADGKPSNAFEVCTERPPLDYANHEARTFRSDLRLIISKPEWRKGLDTLIQSFQLLLFPNVFWAMCLNGLTLGVNIAIGTTYGTVMTSAPYSWPQSSVSYVNVGQIVTSLIALPVFGYGSDILIKWFAGRRNGIHEPEVRIIPLFMPVLIGIFTAVLYGQGAAHPEHYHWFTFVWAVAAYYFTFIAANIVAITYLLDSYPQRASPLLIIICAFRGIISFGVSYGIQPFIDARGYDGAFAVFGALTGVFGLLGVAIFVWGKKIRQFTGRYAFDKEKAS
ncbi:major facilitator superfamily domain-containing protein [Plectosphaerella cucumerina]|uniref:Major facilitator superfamily domain-containing protein n=1 Tax=Plectosphaerella cucumerina TaxID=40658 RepID=A0A8K0X0M6_9PEZI|nr:major facilitator superfamily domain-containing protein [Plectosphaerella cucumerina]